MSLSESIYKVIRGSLLGEALEYTHPTSPETCLFDFYALSWAQSINLPDEGKAPGTDMMGRSTSGFFGRTGIKEDVQAAFASLLPYLQTELLDATFISICSEMRHLFDKKQDKLKDSMDADQIRFTRKYARHSSNVAAVSAFSRSAEEKGGASPKYNTAVDDANRAIKAMGWTKRDFVKYASVAFNHGSWSSLYGGRAWRGIANGWLRLGDARSTQEMAVAIDHVYDLQHNTGTVFNKVARYSQNNGFGWLKRALDMKASANNIGVIIPKCSSQAKKLVRAAAYAAGKPIPDPDPDATSPTTVVDASSDTLTPDLDFSYDEFSDSMDAAIKDAKSLFDYPNSQSIAQPDTSILDTAKSPKELNRLMKKLIKSQHPNIQTLKIPSASGSMAAAIKIAKSVLADYASPPDTSILDTATSPKELKELIKNLFKARYQMLKPNSSGMDFEGNIGAATDSVIVQIVKGTNFTISDFSPFSGFKAKPSESPQSMAAAIKNAKSVFADYILPPDTSILDTATSPEELKRLLRRLIASVTSGNYQIGGKQPTSKLIDSLPEDEPEEHPMTSIIKRAKDRLNALFADYVAPPDISVLDTALSPGEVKELLDKFIKDHYAFIHSEERRRRRRRRRDDDSPSHD